LRFEISLDAFAEHGPQFMSSQHSSRLICLWCTQIRQMLTYCIYISTRQAVY